MMSATDIFKLRRARHAKWVENYLIEQRMKPLEPPEIAVMRKDREVPWQISRLEFKHPFVLCVLQIFFFGPVPWHMLTRFVFSHVLH